MYRFILLVLASFLLLSCQTVTVSPPGETIKYSSEPNYKKSQNFFLFGLIGNSIVNVKSVCGDKPVKQMQSQQTFLNGFLSFVTLWIYTPRTASVWCGEEALGMPLEERI